MARIVFINVPAHGHTNPTLPLVQELVDRGHSVIYYSFDAFSAAITRAGATFRSYQHLMTVDYTRPDPNLFRLTTMLLRTTAQVLPELRTLVATDAPDVIIYDSLCPWGKYLAKILDVPAICSTTTFALNARVAASSPGQIVDFVRMYLAAQPHLREFRAIAHTLQQTYGIPKLQPIDLLRNDGALNLVYTSTHLQPAVKTFPAHYHFVGPSLPARDTTSTFPISLLADTPLIYISLGTLFNENVAFYRLCFAALADLPAQVLISIGSKLDAAALGNVPANTTLRASVPQIMVLQRAQAFVTHGGMNSVHEAFWYGVPMVVIPQAADQQIVAQRIPAVSAGIWLDMNRLTAAQLRAAIERVLSEPAYRVASQAIGQSLAAAGGQTLAADLVEQFLASAA